MLAFFSDSKAVTVFINNYGEQYLDIVSLIILWVMSMAGLVLLLRMIKEEKHAPLQNTSLQGKTVMNEHGLYLGILRNTVYDEKTGSVASILVEPSAEVTQYSGLRNDQGHYVFPLGSIKSVEDIVIIKS
ncbi:MAG: PRC-barrel domain-containing protein [Methanobacteriota archaeon]